MHSMFNTQFSHMKKKATLEEKFLNLKFKLSESSLQLLPDYKQRLKVWGFLSVW